MGPTHAELSTVDSRTAALTLQGPSARFAPQEPKDSVSAPERQRPRSVLAQDTEQESSLLGREESPEELKRIADQLNEIISVVQHRIRFQVSDSTGDLQVLVVDPSTEEVIKTIPPERARFLAEQMSELTGLLVDETR